MQRVNIEAAVFLVQELLRDSCQSSVCLIQLLLSLLKLILHVCIYFIFLDLLGAHLIVLFKVIAGTNEAILEMVLLFLEGLVI